MGDVTQDAATTSATLKPRLLWMEFQLDTDTVHVTVMSHSVGPADIA